MKDLFIISCMFLSIIRLSASEFKHKEGGLLYCKNESKYFVRENSADFVFSEINSIDTAILPHKKRTNEKIYWDIDPGVVFNDYKYGGLGTGFFVDLSINRITLTFRTFTGRGNAPEPKEKAFMIGVNYREKNLFADFVAGIGSITYWCTNGLNQNCNNTTEGSASGLALQMELCLIASKSFGIGFTILSNRNGLDNYTGFMINIKLGLLRQY